MRYVSIDLTPPQTGVPAYRWACVDVSTKANILRLPPLSWCVCHAECRQHCRQRRKLDFIFNGIVCWVGSRYIARPPQYQRSSPYPTDASGNREGGI